MEISVLLYLLSSIIGGVVVKIIDYFLRLREKRRELKQQFKREAYGNFLNKARSFLNDPNMDEEEIINYQKEFIKRYYNEIIVSAPQEVVEAIENFFETVSIAYANKDETTEALEQAITKIRKDLNLSAKDIKFKAYTPNIKQIKKEKEDKSRRGKNN